MAKSVLAASNKSLARTFGISTKDAVHIKEITGKIERHPPFLDDNWVYYNALDQISYIIGGQGSEALFESGNSRNARIIYANMGDPYRDTIYADTHQGKFYVGPWGDWVEQFEAYGGRIR